MTTPSLVRVPLFLAVVLGSSATAQTPWQTEVAHRRSTELLESDPHLAYDPTTLLVDFGSWNSESERATLRSAVGGIRLRRFTTLPDLELVSLSVPVDEAIRRLAPHVRFAEPNWVVRPDQTIPNDSFFGLQYGIHNTGQSIQGVTGIVDADIDGVEAWDITTGDPNFRIAIIDSGTQWSHPDLDGNIWSNPGEIAGNGIDDDGNGYVDDVRGWDFYSNDSNPDDSDGHGTHTAGTVGAEGNNGTGVAGVNWRCKLVPLRFLGPQGGFTSDAILAVEYCTTNNIKVSCNSWGGGGFSTALYNAINASRSIGHVFVAAAGNSGVNTDSSAHYPSSYNLDNIISVAATDNRDALASFSNYGANSVDLGAPGVNIASTWTGSGYVWSSGTSMACPHVTGVVALVYARNPGWTYSQVVDRILSTVRPASSMAGRSVTGGILDARAAVDDGGGGGGDTTPPANPTGLAASAGNGQVSLDWNDNGEADLAGYRVYRSTTSGSGYVEVSSGLLASSAYVDSGVTNGVTYYYVVRAEDAVGNLSGNSNQASATPSGGGGGGPAVLFFDDFEDGNLSGWTIQNSNAYASTASEATGTWGARVRRTSWMEVAVNTSGYSTVELSYWRRTSGMDSPERLYVEYWSGSSWVAIETTRSTSWSLQSYVLPASAANNPSFRLRFRTNCNRNNERADIDDVELIGTP